MKGAGNPKHDKSARRTRPTGERKIIRKGTARNHGTGTTESAQKNRADRKRRIAPSV